MAADPSNPVLLFIAILSRELLLSISIILFLLVGYSSLDGHCYMRCYFSILIQVTSDWKRLFGGLCAIGLPPCLFFVACFMLFT
jgi:hypothetical protein